MTETKIKELLDACYVAKRVRELLPELPPGVTSSYIHYLDTIEQLEKKGMRVKVSDISDTLHLPRPGVTRTVKEMEQKGYLTKTASAEDGRITFLAVTKEGQKLSSAFNTQFFEKLRPILEDISEEDAACTVRTIRQLYHIMSERSVHIEY